MGRIITKIPNSEAEDIEIWTGSPGHVDIHIGFSGNLGSPDFSLTLDQAEAFAVALMAARTRLIGWRQASLDEDVYLSAVDVQAAIDLE